MTKQRLIFAGAGAFIKLDASRSVRAITWVMYNMDTKVVSVKDSEGKSHKFIVTELTHNQATDTIEFVSDQTKYRIRPLREEDGIWLSKYATPLPVTVLENSVRKKEELVESLIAYTLDDSAYVVALALYADGIMYSRVDGEWLPVPSTSTYMSGDNMLGIEISPEKADDFIDLFDKNWVSVADLNEYESADSEVSSEQSDD